MPGAKYGILSMNFNFDFSGIWISAIKHRNDRLLTDSYSLTVVVWRGWKMFHPA